MYEHSNSVAMLSSATMTKRAEGRSCAAMIAANEDANNMLQGKTRTVMMRVTPRIASTPGNDAKRM